MAVLKPVTQNSFSPLLQLARRGFTGPSPDHADDLHERSRVPSVYVLQRLLPLGRRADVISPVPRAIRGRSEPHYL